jgi:uncharacterized membrane protein YkoI
MTADKKSLVIAGIALLCAAAALALAAAAFMKSSDRGTPTPTDVGSVKAIESNLSKLSARVDALGNRAGEAAPRAAAPSANPADDAALRKIADAAVRDYLVRANGRARIPLTDLPPAVKDAALKTIKGAEITQAEQQVKDDKTIFRLKAKLAEDEFDLRIAADGAVIEAGLPIDQLPPAVRNAAAQAIDGWRLSDATMVQENGKTVYDVDGRVGKKKHTVRISAEGQVISVDNGQKNRGPAPGQAGPGAAAPGTAAPPKADGREIF